MTFPPKLEDLKEEDFVVAQFGKKKKVKHFVGKSLSRYDDGKYQISYLRKKPLEIFVFSNINDEAYNSFIRIYIKVVSFNAQ